MSDYKNKQRELFEILPPKKHQYIDLTSLDYSANFSKMNPLIEAGNAKITNEVLPQESLTKTKTSALVNSFCEDVHTIYIKGEQNEPVRINRKIASRNCDKTIIIVEENSIGTVIFEGEGNGFFASSTEIDVKKGGLLNFIQIQDFGGESTVLEHVEARIHKDALIKWTSILLGSKLYSSDKSIQLLEEGSDAKYVEVFFGNKEQVFDTNIDLVHRSPNTSGNVLSKGILKDKSRNVFLGLIKIFEGAQKTNSFLAQHSMLLSKDARCDAIPSLEIAANDVKASHAASMGQIDEEQVFYLMSRGIPREEARKIVVLGFLSPALERIDSDEIKERLTKKIEDKWE